MFRAVFWVVLPCKMIVDRRFRGAYCLHHQGWVSRATEGSTLVHLSFSGQLSPPPNLSPFPANFVAIPTFYEALSRAKLHPLHILCRYTSLSSTSTTAHCHWPVPSLSSPTTTDHLVTRHLYKRRSFCRSAYSSLMMEAVRTSEMSVDNHFTRQYNPEDSSEHRTVTILCLTDEITGKWKLHETDQFLSYVITLFQLQRS
jgi:hypothetical protein